MAGQDSHNFSSSSSHRLPTTSATEVLTKLSSNIQRSISTGLKDLDDILIGNSLDHSDYDGIQGGVSRGGVTEVCGPPGVGKSSLALSVAAKALRTNNEVVWVDTTKSIHGLRLEDFLSTNAEYHRSSSAAFDAGKGLEAFHHFTAPTLPHLLALLAHPTNDFPPPNTGLLVVDDLSTLFSLSFRNMNEKSNDQQLPGKASQVAQWASGRRWVVMDHLISDLSKLAVTKNLAILLTSQMTTRIQDEARAVLCPALSGHAWESGISTRIVLFRDWLLDFLQISEPGDLPSTAHFAGVTKVQNLSYEGVGRVMAFRITKFCLKEVSLDAVAIEAHTSSVVRPISLKRRHKEVADSESEDGDNVASDHEFGWDDAAVTLEAERLSTRPVQTESTIESDVLNFQQASSMPERL